MSLIASISDIASALNISRQAVDSRRKKGKWLPTGELVRGGGGLYAIGQTSLTKDERKAVKKWLDGKGIRSAVKAVQKSPSYSTPESPNLPCAPPTTAVAVTKPADLQSLSTLKEWQRKCMDARIFFMRLIEKAQAAGIGINRACAALEERSHSGDLPAEAARLVPVANQRSGKDNRKRALSASTLIKWWSTWLKSGKNPTSLAPKDTELDESGQVRIPVWAPYFLEYYCIPQKPSVPQALERLAAHIPPSIPLPSDDQVYRFIKKFSKLDIMKGRMTGAELKRQTAFTRRDTSDLVPMAVTLCDGHSFKAYVASPRHGRHFKPEICAVLDAATCCVVGWSTGLSESNQTVADAVRHAMTVNSEKTIGGMIAIFYTDKGAGNQADVNADPYLGRYNRLGMTFKTGMPGNPRAHGKIERLNKSLWIPLAKQLPTYTGKDMDKGVARKVYLHLEKEVREAKKLSKKPESKLLISWPEFLEICRVAVNAYNNRPHSALPKIYDAKLDKKRNMTPLERWNSFLTMGWRPDILPEDHLADLFRPREESIARNGEVNLFGNKYFHKDLQHFHGTKVIVEYEVQDGRNVWVRDAEHQRLICVAGFEANKRAFFPVSAVDDALDKRANRREGLKLTQIEEIRAERDGFLDMVNIEQPVEAIEMRRQLELKMKDEKQSDLLPAATPLLPSNVISLEQESEKQRYNRWKKLKELLMCGERISVEDYRFVDGYADSHQCKAFQQVEGMAVMNK